MSPRLVLLGVLLLTAVSYWPMRQNGWVYEDGAMHGVADGEDLGLSRWTGPSRNLARVSVYLPARMFGPSPQVAHGVGLLLHLLNGVLLFLLARRWMAEGPALLATAIFLWHPIGVYTAAYVASRPDLLMTTFLLGMVLLMGPLSMWRIAALTGCLVGACWSKQSGVLAVPLLLALSADGRRWLVGGLWGGLLIGAVLVLLPQWQTEPLAYDRWTNAGIQAAAWWRQIALVVWPSGFTIDHPIALIPLWLGRVALLAWVALAGGVVLIWGRWPLVAVAVGWLFLMGVPRLLLQLPEMFSEHQLYPAMPAASLLLGMGLSRVWISALFPERSPYAAL